MNMVFKFTLYTLLILFTQTTHANIEVTFIEGAPKDKFVIKNTGSCSLKDLSLNIDLKKSAGKLIFDTTATGEGVDVFQPFEVSKGNIKLAAKAKVDDGDSELTLSIPTLAKGETVSFTIDVDDTLTVSELGNVRVSGSEIKNGMVNVSSATTRTTNAAFGDNNTAIVLISECSS